MGESGIVQQCHICGRIIFGAGPLVRHAKACKRKLCEQCKENCNAKEWWLPCPKKNTGILSSFEW